MVELFQGLRWIHIAAGTVALIVFWIPVSLSKGSRGHIRAGWIYVACMAVIVLTAFLMSGLTFADPLGVRAITHPLTDQETARLIHTSRLFAIFLSYLAAVTLAAGWQGVWVLRTRRNPKSFRTPFNLTLNGAVVLSALAVLAMGLKFRYAPFIALSPVGLVVGGGNLSYLLRGPQSPMHWWYEHLGAMITTGIAGYTAFIVFGGSRLFPGLSSSRYYTIFWILPTLVGSPAIALTVRFYKRKFQETGKRTPAPNAAGEAA
jgi:hypothetical protein